jgi:hypothetical protein
VVYKKMKKILLHIILICFGLGMVFVSVQAQTTVTTGDLVPGTPSADASKGIVQCGRAGQPMCKLCDLIVGINIIINYIFSIVVIVAIFSIFVGGIVYIVSAGTPGLTEKAKGAIKSAIIGVVIVFTAWIMVNFTMTVLGAKTNLGVSKITNGWNNFTCTP